MVRRVIRGYIIGGVILSFVGSYLVASGINQLAVSPTGGSIFVPVFPGLMLILGAFCLLLNSVGMAIKGKVNWVQECIKDWTRK